MATCVKRIQATPTLKTHCVQTERVDTVDYGCGSEELVYDDIEDDEDDDGCDLINDLKDPEWQMDNEDVSEQDSEESFEEELKSV